jgi:hypothetical protein
MCLFSNRSATIKEALTAGLLTVFPPSRVNATAPADNDDGYMHALRAADDTRKAVGAFRASVAATVGGKERDQPSDPF